jgi:LysR family transcriptional regulator, low CO2-responsive transcriptional regulator
MDIDEGDDGPSLDALRSFVVFSEHLNFTRAAEHLHISQPALHTKVRKLGEALRVTLYTRKGRRVELTEHGHRVASFAREMQERSRSFVRALRGADGRSTVTLAAGEGAYLYLLADGLRRFLRRDRASLRLLTLDGHGSVEAVRAGRAELGVAPLESVPDGFQARVLARVEQVLALPQRHPLARKPWLRLQDMDGLRLVVPPPGRPQRALLAHALQSAKVSWQPAVEATGWELMTRFVQLGLGLAVVNGFCAMPRGVVARPLRGLPAIHYHLFHLESLAAEGPAARLKQALIAEAPQ